MESSPSFKTLKISPASPTSSVFHLCLNRPSQLNSLSLDFFNEFPEALSFLDHNPAVRVIILSGGGRHFCSGIDISSLQSTTSDSTSDRGRSNEQLHRRIKHLQDAITAIETCRKPVIAAVHGACFGGGIDIITACDLRYCTKDAFFSVKEVDLAIVADLGTLQRLPGIVGYGKAVELALTGRRFVGVEAKEIGLISQVFKSGGELDQGVMAVAEGIASKSPLAVTGTKAVLLKGRDFTVDQGLDYIATWNSAMLVSDDLKEAVAAHVQKRKPMFAKL